LKRAAVCPKGHPVTLFYLKAKRAYRCWRCGVYYHINQFVFTPAAHWLRKKKGKYVLAGNYQS